MVYKAVRPIGEMLRLPVEGDRFESALATKSEWRVEYGIGVRTVPNAGQMPLFAFNTPGDASGWLSEMGFFDCMIFEAQEERTTCPALKDSIVLPFNMTPIFCSSITLVKYIKRKHKE